MAHAMESGHWYRADSGEPCYQVPNASKPGEFRNTTLKDAKKLGLVPSVTTVQGILEKPQLIRWKVKQAILASLTMPRPSGMSDDDYLDALIDDANRQSIDAMGLGTKVHAAIQGAYEGELWLPEMEVYCFATMNAITKEFGNKKWICEKSFAHPLGFGGKCDMYSEDRTILVDFKTTQSNGEKLKKVRNPEHLLQLSAYRLGLGLERASLANVYISTTVPGEVYIKNWTEDQALQGTKEWIALLNYWKISKKFMLPEG